MYLAPAAQGNRSRLPLNMRAVWRALADRPTSRPYLDLTTPTSASVSDDQFYPRSRSMLSTLTEAYQDIPTPKSAARENPPGLTGTTGVQGILASSLG